MAIPSKSENPCSDTQLAEAIWSDRRQALYDMIDQFVGSDPPGRVASRYAGVTVPRWGTLQPLIERLRAFARRQYDYFHQGFNYGDLVISTAIPPNSVYSAILNQTGNDLDVIQSIILQRLSSPSLETELLQEADQLAMFSLVPAREAGLVEPEATALTYFQKSPRIQVIPYAPVALIGIPFTAMRTSSDLLGTAHETGHYVFWHGRIPTPGKPRGEWPFLFNVLRDEVDAANVPGWCSVWLEEMFCDIYGCLVLGPVLAVSCQELQRNRTENEFRRSDNDHPVPRLRPTIYHKVLQRSASAARRAWVEKLARRWQNLVNNQGLTSTSSFVVSGVKHIDTDILVGQATDESNFALNPAKPIDRLIDLILAHLSDIEHYWPDRLPYPDLPPLELDNDDAAQCALYEWFDTVRAAALSKVTAADTLPLINLDQLWPDWFEEHGFDQWTTPLGWKTPPNPKAGWGYILEAGGWTTEPQEKPWP